MADFYQLSVEDVFKSTGGHEEGLSDLEYKDKLAKFGKNELPRESGFKALKFIWGQIKSPLIYILLIAAALSYFVGEKIDTGIIMASVVLNIGIGFYQEYSSSQILKRLAEKVKVMALVKRIGGYREVEAAELVPGDIIAVKNGMKIPADARLFRAKGLLVNESLLTGESEAVKKITDKIKGDKGVGDRKNMIFMGSAVEGGECEAIVVKTGRATEIGQIATLTEESGEELTPLQERMEKLGKFLSVIVVISSILIIGVGLFEKIRFYQIFVTSVAVAVAAIPEGLPAGIAVVLAIASRNIFKHNGLVKKLLAAETLGSVSILLIDKTGTLTEGRMKLEKIISKNEDAVLIAIALANEAIVENDNGKMVVKGEATDKAKLEAFLDKKLDLKKIEAAFPKINFLPFDSERKLLASFNATKTSQGDAVRVFISGAPEILLKLSTSFPEKEEMLRSFEDLARKGFRVIAAAEEILPMNKDEVAKKSEEELAKLINNITFLGLAVIRDPIRADVRQTVKEIRSAGIKIIMLTGDHKLTASTVGGELGFNTDNIIEGAELDKISEEKLKEIILNTEIFARVDPKHKLMVTKAWKDRGEAVAVTGDGINDAPALKYADIGIALNSGTDVTKEAADMVLVDDSLSTIAEAIKYGRTAFDNIKKISVFLLSGSFSEIILVLGSLLLKMPLPLTAAQILWMNLVEDGLPNFALAFEKSEDGIMNRKPIKRSDPLLDKQAKALSYTYGIIADVVVLTVFYLLDNYTELPLDYLRTFMFVAIGCDALIYIFSLKALNKSIFETNLFDNKYLLFSVGIGFLMMGVAIYVPFFNLILKTSPLHLNILGLILALAIFKVSLMEYIKYFYNKRAA